MLYLFVENDYWDNVQFGVNLTHYEMWKIDYGQGWLQKVLFGSNG